MLIDNALLKKKIVTWGGEYNQMHYMPVLEISQWNFSLCTINTCQ
jgi:hypothetical protein